MCSAKRARIACAVAAVLSTSNGVGSVCYPDIRRRKTEIDQKLRQVHAALEELDAREMSIVMSDSPSASADWSDSVWGRYHLVQAEQALRAKRGRLEVYALLFPINRLLEEN